MMVSEHKLTPNATVVAINVVDDRTLSRKGGDNSFDDDGLDIVSIVVDGVVVIVVVGVEFGIISIDFDVVVVDILY